MGALSLSLDPCCDRAAIRQNGFSNLLHPDPAHPELVQRDQRSDFDGRNRRDCRGTARRLLPLLSLPRQVRETGGPQSQGKDRLPGGQQRSCRHMHGK